MHDFVVSLISVCAGFLMVGVPAVFVLVVIQAFRDR